MNKVKIAIVGVGSISSCHIEGYLKNPNAEIYAFCDINEARLKEKGEKYGITRLYTDEAKMLEELPEIDAVSVCTWNSAHAPCTIMALNAGKHVLCEKPMATTVEDAVAMKEAAEKNGKILAIGFVRRFQKSTELVLDLIKNGEVGEMYYAKAAYIRRCGHPGGWFGDKSRSGGGPLIDLGVHVIDLVRYVMGKPKAVSVYGATYAKLGQREDIKASKAYTSADKSDKDICDCEDLATALIRFDNGATLAAEMSFSLNTGGEDGGVRIFGTKAGLKLDGGVTMFSSNAGHLTDTVYCNAGINDGDAFDLEMAHFVDCIQNGTECINPAEDGIEVMKILCAIYKSAEIGHEVVI